MPYTSLDRLTRRFGTTMLVQLTDRGEVATGIVDVATVDDALADTDAVINASLGVRYRLPLADVPAMVADIALSIAIYKLHITRPEEKIERDYDQALKDLRDLGSGAKKLDVAGVEPETSGASGVITSDRPRDFTPDNMRGFI
jgi:phage gp36-like protein